MNVVHLTDIPEFWNMDTEQIINYMLDHDCDTLVNNFGVEPHMEYSLADIQEIWENTVVHYRKLFRYA